MKNESRISVRTLTAMALLIAMSIVFSRVLSISTGFVRFNLGSLPVLLAGILFGPWAGFVVGMVADIIGGVLAGYAINPLITLGAASIGLVGGLGWQKLSHLRTGNRLWCSVLAAHFVGSMVINSLALHIFYGYAWAVLIARIPNALVLTAVNTVLLRILLENRALMAMAKMKQIKRGVSMNYESALEYIHAVQWAGHKPGLSRTRTLLAALGDPHKKLRFVHVAGTNGKGSTAAMLASCLQAAGYRVGLYTSPFINRFNERIQVNGEQIPDDALVRLVERVRPAADAMADVPTEFEIITALGMLWFAEEKCDIVVLEVGLGGTLDSTNVIDPPECAVITALGMDHVKELGPTIADIAAAKAGIIKPGSPVVSYGGVPEADAVIARVAREQNAPLTVVDLSRLKVEGGDLDAVTFDFDGLDGVRLPLIGSYQPKNAALAITALRVLRGRGWNIPDSAIRTGLEQVSWPGRFELLRHSPAFLLDGSHNAHGMRATVQSLRDRFPGQKFVFLLSIMADKDVDEMLALLLPLAKRFVTVAAHTPRAMPAETLAEHIRARGGKAEAAADIPAGVARAVELGGDGPVCALGTLYFSGDVRQAFARLTAE